MGVGAVDVTLLGQRIEISEVDVRDERVRIRLFVPRSILYTSELPSLAPRLLEELPELASTLCHNDHGLNFRDELYATEMGHVVEHMVLTLLMERGIYAKGTTEWNWFDEPEGTFTVTLTGEYFEAGGVGSAIADALSILERLVVEDVGDRSLRGLLIA